MSAMEAPEHENPFPTWPTVAHELGHWMVAWQVTTGSGVSFYTRHPGELAIAEYSKAGVSADNRLVIAVAGAIAQQEVGRVGLCDAQPNPEDVFLAEPGNVPPQFSGDYDTVQEFAPKEPAKHRKLVLAAIARSRQMIESAGGVKLITAMGKRIFRWLEEDNRARWKTSLDDHYACSSVNFYEGLSLNMLRELIAADPSLAADGGKIVTRIEQVIEARKTPPPRR